MRNYRRILVLVFALMLFVLSAPMIYAASITLHAPVVEGLAGGTVDVPIQVVGASDLGALHVEVVYDPAVLKAEAVTAGALAGNNALVEGNVDRPGRVIIGIVAPDSINGDGVVANVRFQVIGNARQNSVLTLENGAAWERTSYAEMLVQTEAGQVTIAAGLPAWLIPAVIALICVLAMAALMLLIFLFARRRRAATHGSGRAAVPSFPSPHAPSAPPLDLPSRHTAASLNDAFKHAEDEYFRLKGQFSMGRITHEQFEKALTGLRVQDAQGRYWMLGVDNATWYVQNGQGWVEGQPY